MTTFLIDTNILIYYLAGAFTPDQKLVIDPVLEGSFTISIITRIEFLGLERSYTGWPCQGPKSP